MLPPISANRAGMAEIESPCIKVCVLDPSSQHCLGCGRSLAEIARWAALSPEERRRIMAELPARMAARRAAERSGAR
jgi:predicted Fe-S protein YdhL (DUF1289 family)